MSELLEKQELVSIEEKTVLAAFSEKDGLAQVVDQARALVDGFEHDLSTGAGRKRTASLSRKVSNLKVRLDGLGKDLVADWKAKSAKVDTNRRAMKIALEQLRDEARQPLTDWEEAEKARVEAIRQRIESMEWSHCNEDGTDCTASQLQDQLTLIESVVIDESFAEYEAQAARQKDVAVTNLRSVIQKRQQYEVEQEELARLRKEQEEREQREYEERLKQEAADKARQEAEAVAKAEADRIEREKEEALEREEEAKHRAEVAEREKIAAEERAKIEAEQAEERRIAAEKKAEEDAKAAAEAARQAEIRRQLEAEAKEKAEQEAREANNRHVASIRGQAKQALMGLGLTEELAKKVVLAIHNQEVPNVSIKY